MASKYFLVFKGRVKYMPEFKQIGCFDDEVCFWIKLDPSTKVTIKNSRKRFDWIYNALIYYGEELLADGERYWVRLSKPKCLNTTS